MDESKYVLAMTRLGSRLKEIRLEENLTQNELSYRCDLDIRTIQRIEKGEQNVSLKILFTISEALNVSPTDLINYSIES